jgi:predicted lipoprotein with Yx(FWY)xxD motif
MKLAILLGTAALAVLSTAAFAEDYAGGAIKTADIGGKEVLTDANGMTLYTFDKDTAGVSNCYDKCAVNWPPLFAADDAKDEGEFTIVTRTDGTRMWAHEGKPLYLWIKDEKPGDTTGDMVGEVWHTAYD